MGFKVVEKSLSIDNILDAHKAVVLYELFGNGKTATITFIRELRY